MKKNRKAVTDNELETEEGVKLTFEILKEIFKVTTDLDLAKKIGISPTAMYNHRVRGTIPFRGIVLSARENGFSIDDVLSKMRNSKVDFSGKQYLITPYAEFGQTGRPIVLSSELLESVDGFENNSTFYVKINQEYSLSPTLTVGDTALVSTDTGQIRNYDGIFLCRINGRNTIKRLQFLPGGVVNVEGGESNPYRLERYNYVWSDEDSDPDKPDDRMKILSRVIWAGVKH